MAEHLTRMHKVLGSIPNIGKKNNNKGNHMRKASGCHVKENRIQDDSELLLQDPLS